MNTAKKMQAICLDSFRKKHKREEKIAAGERLLSVYEVADKIGVHHKTIYKWVNAGQFPRQRKLAGRTARWLESEVEAHIRATQGKNDVSE